jgi:hypothetical protein
MHMARRTNSSSGGPSTGSGRGCHVEQQPVDVLGKTALGNRGQAGHPLQNRLRLFCRRVRQRLAQTADADREVDVRTMIGPQRAANIRQNAGDSGAPSSSLVIVVRDVRGQIQWGRDWIGAPVLPAGGEQGADGGDGPLTFGADRRGNKAVTTWLEVSCSSRPGVA